jgi:hypothetical protein
MARRKEIADTHFVQQTSEQQEEPNSFSVPLCPVANLEQSYAENEGAVESSERVDYPLAWSALRAGQSS